MQNILILFNPVAGGRRSRRLRAVLDLLRGRGAQVELRTTGAPGDARRFAGDAAGDVDTIVAAGGDGTINEVVNGMAARGGSGDAPDLALLPLGTANVLATEIGFPRPSARRIADAIAEGAPGDLYLGRADDRYFALMCGVGFDAHVVARVSPHLKRRLGKLAYVLASLVELWRYRPRRYAVTVNGRRHDAASAIVANAHFYGGRFVVAPLARIDDPRLQVCLFHQAGRRHVLRYGWGLISGRLYRFADVSILPADKVEIAAVAPEPMPEPVQGDGDIIAALPVAITAGAKHLRIRKP